MRIGLIDGLGPIFKAITENLAADGQRSRKQFQTLAKTTIILHTP